MNNNKLKTAGLATAGVVGGLIIVFGIDKAVTATTKPTPPAAARLGILGLPRVLHEGQPYQCVIRGTTPHAHIVRVPSDNLDAGSASVRGDYAGPASMQVYMLKSGHVLARAVWSGEVQP